MRREKRVVEMLNVDSEDTRDIRRRKIGTKVMEEVCDSTEDARTSTF